ncbi:hypothetical protein SCP_1001250 [Sparassis crispa]|uniref:Uncharacterized protein n=1 Tax=Sparassis crispa TaxID=139825 RepID=A0A401GXH0_9APHY|nr:hypothetical protein SCP_1001250 [Sparassis crispa]GBE86882.1 hypothetical protein SCP_1001250 [Sparassis crispa]
MDPSRDSLPLYSPDAGQRQLLRPPLFPGALEDRLFTAVNSVRHYNANAHRLLVALELRLNPELFYAGTEGPDAPTWS